MSRALIAWTVVFVAIALADLTLYATPLPGIDGDPLPFSKTPVE